jgi:uncharacterized protein YprB with RNaseH-like and TPR domain
MLTSTYVHLDGIGYSTERRLWQAGAWRWEDFPGGAPGAAPALRFSPARLALCREQLGRSRERLAAGDYRFFSDCLPRRDQWRAFPDFAHRVLYLDIETTGSGELDEVTVIGVHDGRTLRQFVRDENLLEAEEVLADPALLVTFFGTGFDVPVLRRLFPRLPFAQLHVDLCHALRRLGLGGGLKAVEQRLGLRRAPDLEGLSGWDAVRLWREHCRGQTRSLELLLRYNAADVENMIPLVEFAYRMLREKTLASVEGGELPPEAGMDQPAGPGPAASR